MWGIFENLYFCDFGDFVNWFFSYVPVFIIITFSINCVFSILSDFFRLGGGKK